MDSDCQTGLCSDLDRALLPVPLPTPGPTLSPMPAPTPRPVPLPTPSPTLTPTPGPRTVSLTTCTQDSSDTSDGVKVSVDGTEVDRETST